MRESIKFQQQAKALAVKTNLKAGECCWDTFSKAKLSGKSSDWQAFWNCCNKDSSCTYGGRSSASTSNPIYVRTA